jgi:hypothetical protein
MFGMGGLPDKDHLDDLLDSALAETFPASDPTSSFVCECEPPPRKEDATTEGAGPGLPKERPG